MRIPRSCRRSQSESDALVTPILGGAFVRLDYTWAFDGAPQAGTLLIGCEAQPGRFTVVWGDTWHMGEKLLLSQGEAADAAALHVFGSYAVEGWPDWGWRTVLQIHGDGSLQLQMYNVTPEGEATLAEDATYTRRD